MNHAHGGRQEEESVVRRLTVPTCKTDMFRASKEVATTRNGGQRTSIAVVLGFLSQSLFVPLIPPYDCKCWA